MWMYSIIGIIVGDMDTKKQNKSRSSTDDLDLFYFLIKFIKYIFTASDIPKVI